MATASTFGDYLASSTGQASIDLLDDWAYAIAHSGKTVAGVADTDPIILSHDGAATNDLSAETGKIVLHANQAIVLPAGHKKLYYQAATALPAFQLAPCELMLGGARV